MAATERTGLTVDTPSDREIVMTRSFEAPRELVWEAWTSPGHLPHWMLGPEGWTMPVCEIDLRPGGAHRSVWRHPDGSEMEIRGVYREVEAPARLVYTDSWGQEWQRQSIRWSWSRRTAERRGDGAELHATGHVPGQSGMRAIGCLPADPVGGILSLRAPRGLPDGDEDDREARQAAEARTRVRR